MLQLIQIYLGTYKVSAIKVQQAIHTSQISILKALLLRAPHASRHLVLQQLSKMGFSHDRLVNPLIKILADDSIDNGKLALALIAPSINNYPRHHSLFQKAKSRYLDKLRRKANRDKSNDKFPSRTSLTMVDKKKNMNRLEKVRKDVKKGMSRLG